MKRLFLLTAALLSLAASLAAQDVRSELRENPLRYGGSSSPYEYIPGMQTLSPKGFKPFYISHFGRHGSRYHTNNAIAPSLLKVFRKGDSLGILTPLGRDVYGRIRTAEAASTRRAGELTPVGEREHREIAARMVSAHPAVFSARTVRLTARSTTSARVLVSMASFLEEVRSRCPQAVISHEAGDRTNAVLNHYTPAYRAYYEDGPWKEMHDTWLAAHFHSEGIIARLFTQPALFDGDGDGKRARRFARDLFSLAKILPAYGLGVTLADAFPEEDLYTLWQAGNMEQYLRKGPSALAPVLAPGIAAPLLEDFLLRGEEAVAGGTAAADLRFGHGEGIMPLAALMGLESAATVCGDPDRIAACWQDYRITTMGANIQWVFYRNRKGEVLVQVLLNEREVRVPVPGEAGPYYPWKALKAYYQTVLQGIPQ